MELVVTAVLTEIQCIGPKTMMLCYTAKLLSLNLTSAKRGAMRQGRFGLK